MIKQLLIATALISNYCYSMERNAVKLPQGYVISKEEEHLMRQGQISLLEAASKGYVALCKRLLDKGSSVTEKTIVGSTPLHKAAGNGHTKTCQLLLSNGALVTGRNNYDSTPLHWAALDGHTETCQLLLSNGALVTGKTTFGLTPLHCAAQKGHSKTCQLLLSNGALVTEKDKNGATPLHNAAVNGHSEVSQLLLDNGALVTEKDNSGKTPLHYAAENGRSKTCKLLLRCGAPWEANLFNKLGLPQGLKDSVNTYYSQRHNLLTALELTTPQLLNVKTTYRIALLLRDYPVILKLIESWKNDEKEERLSTWGDSKGRNILMLACDDEEHDVVNKLIENGCKLSMKDTSGHKAFWYAARKDYNLFLTLLRATTKTIDEKEVRKLDTNALPAMKLLDAAKIIVENNTGIVLA